MPIKSNFPKEQFMNKTLKICKLTIISFLVTVFVILVWEKVALSNSLSYEYNFSTEPSFIQGFFPEGRILQTDEWQQINSEPVYITVYTPREYKTANIKFRYYKPYDAQAKLGLKLNVNDWAFYFNELKETPDGFFDQEMEFDLAQAERINNKYKFILAINEFGWTGDKFLADNIQIEFIK